MGDIICSVVVLRSTLSMVTSNNLAGVLHSTECCSGRIFQSAILAPYFYAFQQDPDDHLEGAVDEVKSTYYSTCCMT